MDLKHPSPPEVASTNQPPPPAIAEYYRNLIWQYLMRKPTITVEEVRLFGSLFENRKRIQENGKRYLYANVYNDF